MALYDTDSTHFFSLIIGLSNYANKAHICRAALEAVCFQSKEVYGYYSNIYPFLLSVDLLIVIAVCPFSLACILYASIVICYFSIVDPFVI